MIIPYTKHTPFDIPRPLIDVTLINPYNQKQTKAPALVDSGADDCIFPWYLGKRIELNLRSGPTYTGNSYTVKGFLGISRKVYVHSIDIVIQGKYLIADMMCGFTDRNMNISLLGRNCFFEKFNVHFYHNQRKIDIIKLK